MASLQDGDYAIAEGKGDRGFVIIFGGAFSYGRDEDSKVWSSRRVGSSSSSERLMAGNL
jgi:hypothetical protein